MILKGKTYRIERRRTGLFFVCLDCGHAIDVRYFYKASGSRSPRTQAAAAMKLHQEQGCASPGAKSGPSPTR